MFSSTFARAAHRAPPVPVAAVSSTSSATAAHRSSQCLANRPTHQRRPSSSKASCPPDSSKPAPAAKAAASDNATQSSASAPSQPPRSIKRIGRNKRFHGLPLKSKAPTNQWEGLPAVPGVQHLKEKGTTSFYDKCEHMLITGPRLWAFVLLLVIQTAVLGERHPSAILHRSVQQPFRDTERA